MTYINARSLVQRVEPTLLTSVNLTIACVTSCFVSSVQEVHNVQITICGFRSEFGKSIYSSECAFNPHVSYLINGCQPLWNGRPTVDF